MEWPSQNVPQGGFLHPRKVDFSPDTAKFLKELIQESKLSIRQKSKFENMLRNDQVRFYKSPKPTRRTPEITIRPGSPRKRSMQTILQSGAYEREKFVPLHPRIDREKEKEKLQHIMAYNQEVAPKQEWPMDRKLKRESPPAPQVNRYDLCKCSFYSILYFLFLIYCIGCSGARNIGKTRMVGENGGIGNGRQIQADYSSTDSGKIEGNEQITTSFFEIDFTIYLYIF